MAERLQKLIAEAGLASRRHAEEMITAGEVTVNGQVVRELGSKADPAQDHIKVRGRLINSLLARETGRTYVLLNKPRGVLTSLADAESRPLVIDLVPKSLGRLHPVGRLDFNTEGLLLLTNDGELTNIITSARSGIPKVYEAKVKGVPPESAIERLRRGITIEDDKGMRVRTTPAQVTKTDETKTNAWFEVVLREGRNQQIRRMFDAIGHSVIKLRRVAIGGLRDERLAPGKWRMLTASEVAQLKGTSKKSASAKSSKKSATSHVKKRPDVQ